MVKSCEASVKCHIKKCWSEILISYFEDFPLPTMNRCFWGRLILWCFFTFFDPRSPLGLQWALRCGVVLIHAMRETWVESKGIVIVFYLPYRTCLWNNTTCLWIILHPVVPISTSTYPAAYTSAGRTFALVESWLEICGGSIFHVHFAWQVWDGQIITRLDIKTPRRYSRGEIWPESCWQKDSRGKEFAVRRLLSGQCRYHTEFNTRYFLRIPKHAWKQWLPKLNPLSLVFLRVHFVSLLQPFVFLVKKTTQKTHTQNPCGTTLGQVMSCHHGPSSKTGRPNWN